MTFPMDYHLCEIQRCVLLAAVSPPAESPTACQGHSMANGSSEKSLYHGINAHFSVDFAFYVNSSTDFHAPSAIDEK